MPKIVDFTSSELDYFAEKPYQNMVRDGIYSEIKAGQDKESLLTFIIPESPAYIDLSKSSISIRLKITKDGGTALAETDIVGPVNNFFHSLFKQAIVKINDVEVENSNGLYAYRAYITDTLNHGTEAKNTFLQNALYIPDTSGEMDTTTLPKKIEKGDDLVEKQKLNTGYLRRRSILMKGTGEIEVKGVPHLDIFNNGKFLLNQTNVQIELYFNNPNFFLMGTGNYSMKIQSASLFIKKVTPNDNIQNAINMQLQKSPALYNMNRVFLVSKKIQNDALTQSIEISNGIVPKRVILCMVDDIASTVGKIDKNPYNFEHFNLVSCKLCENGTNVSYSDSLKFNFDKGHFLDGYWTLFDGIDKPYLGNNISREDYANGYMFIAYDLTANGECEPFNNILRSGTITVDLVWTTKTEKSLKLIAYLEYDKTLKLDIFRNIVKDE